jgi:nitrate reductase delta subunit
MRSRERILGLFADVLDYPGPGFLEIARELEQALAEESPPAAARLSRYRALVEQLPLGRLQELYTGAFDLDTLSDLDATLYPYVGHHLFGESYKRSAFLIELAERFRAAGFTVERELPDHLVVILRFLATHPDWELSTELAADALLPALVRMTGDQDETDPPVDPASGRRVYQQVLGALRLALEDTLGPGADEPVVVLPAGPVETR